tara:strand:+ start:1366 stop:1923 length:558 start_codon:yes stop_codon:yes gene_type:complete
MSSTLKMNNRFESLKTPKSVHRPVFRIRSKRPESKRQEFVMKYNAFPELSATKLKNSESDMDFVTATTSEENIKIIDEVDPGWMKISRSNNKVVYKTNDDHIVTDTNDEENQKGLDATQEENLYRLTERWQNKRDQENIMYPNTSLYINEKSLLDPLSDDCYDTESDCSESEPSMEDPDDYYDDM